MPHIVVVGAIVLGGLGFLGYALYEQHKERQRYGYQHCYNHSHHNTFRHSNDFDFDFEDNEENDEKHHDANNDTDRYTLEAENSQLRNRKPFPNEASDDVDNRRKSIDQDQYELDELESAVAERKRRLMAEQSFLDKEEEQLQNRRRALMEQEQIFEKCCQDRKPTTNSSSDGASDNDQEPLDVFKSFVERKQSSQSMENCDNNCSSGDETGIFIDKAEVTTTQASSFQDAEDNNQCLYSSDLQFPRSSRTPTESEASVSSNESGTAISSEGSWDVFSENEWDARHTDDEA